MPMRLEVYPTAGEAFEAAAALAADGLRAASGRPTIALTGGRGGRGVMVALAARDDVPWERVEWLWGDERCVPPGDPLSNVRLARDSLLVPRAIAAERIHPPPLELGDPGRIAAAYAAVLREQLAPGSSPAFDVVLLGVGTNTHIASLMPGSSALAAEVPVAAVPVSEVSEDPIVARITITPPVLAAARRVIVTVSGDEKAGVVAAALRDPVDPSHVPAQLVRPSERVTWIVDRAAAATLLRDARPAASD
jgi:6-phosphogluconolactonase